MRYAGVIQNDVINGEGVCTSFFTQGCPHHCPGCFNPETWDPKGGIQLPVGYKEKIYKILTDNNIERNLYILGGEPLSPWNLIIVKELIKYIKSHLPHIKIYLWTGYTLEELNKNLDKNVKYILSNIDYLIDGKFIEEQKDLTLHLRGSKNQRIFQNINGSFNLIS